MSSAPAHDPVAQTITVQPVPAGPLVVCDAPFLSTLGQVEREVAHLAVDSPDTAQAASNLLQRLTTAGKKLDTVRLAVGAPLRAKLEEINAAARAPNDRIEAAKRGIKAKITAWDAAQAEAARKAEEARQAELRRLEEQRQREAAEAAKKAEELARQAREAAEKRKAPIVDLDWDEAPAEPPPKTETEKKIEAVQFAPAVVAAKPAGVAMRVTLRIEAIDLAKLPDAFVIRTANEAGIRATFCQRYKDGDPLPVCSGVTFRVFREPVSTGKAVF